MAAQGLIDRLEQPVVSSRPRARGSVSVEWAEPAVREQFIAGIVFNVGRADEQLADAGVSHLVEHLALPAVESQRPRYGGSVTPTSTDLWFTGDCAADVLRALDEACTRIESISHDRFERERLVLRAEGDRNEHPLNVGLALRYGAHGVGLAGYPQLGLGWLEPGDVRQWTRRYLCAENAAVWMNFEPPPALDLALPQGQLNVRAEPVVLEGLRFPNFVAGPSNQVALHLVRPRSAEGVMAVQVIAGRVLAELRGGRGLAYGVWNYDEPVTALTSAATIVSDVRTEHAAVATGVLSRVLIDVAANGCGERELAEIVTGSQRAFAEGQSSPGALRANAAAALGGAPRLDVDAYLSEQRDVTPASIAACVSRMIGTAMVSAPPPASAPTGFADYPRTWSPRVTGRRHQWRPSPKHVVTGAGAYTSAEGVSVVWANGSEVTIDLATAPLMVVVDEARRGLWGCHGEYVEVDRENFTDGDALIDAIDRAVPMDRVRVDGDRRRAREAIRAQVAVLTDARRRLIATLALMALVIAAMFASQPTAGVGILFPCVLLSRLVWRTARIKLRPVRVGAITTVVQRTLQAGERLERLATGKLQGRGAGLIILTDRRLVFVQHGSVLVSVSRAEVISARTSWLSSTLELRAPERRIRFDYVTRRNRVSIARELNAAPSQRPTDGRLATVAS